MDRRPDLLAGLMPWAGDVLRAYRRPRTSVKAYQLTRIGLRPGTVCLEPGQRLDFFGPDARRLGWARVEPTGDLSLFDTASNRVGTVRLSGGYAGGNGARAYVKPVEALKEGEVLEIGPEGKRGVWREIGGNPVFVEVDVEGGESVQDAVRRVQGESRSGKLRPTRVAPILTGAERSLGLAELKKKFGANTTKAREIGDRVEDANLAFYKALSLTAYADIPVLESADLKGMAKAWAKWGHKISPADVASLITKARAQAEESIAFAQWYHSNAGKEAFVTLYRGFGPKEVLKNGKPGSHEISFWTDDPQVAAKFTSKTYSGKPGAGKLLVAKVPIGSVISSYQTSGGRLSDETKEFLIDRGFKVTKTNGRWFSKAELEDVVKRLEYAVEDLPAWRGGLWAKGAGLMEFPPGASLERIAKLVGMVQPFLTGGIPLDLAYLSALGVESVTSLKEGVTPQGEPRR